VHINIDIVINMKLPEIEISPILRNNLYFVNVLC